MARFTHLGDDDMTAIAGLFGLGTVERWSAIDAGTINSNFSLRSGRGRFFVRVNEGKREEDVAWEAALVGALAARGVPTPRPMEARGRGYGVLGGRFISVFPWVEGHHVERSEVTPVIAAQVGASLAGMHAAADGLAGVAGRVGIYTFESIAERLRGLGDLSDPTIRDAFTLLANEATWLRAHPVHDSDRGITHGDLFRDNVLFRDGELVALLDFEQAATESRIYDLAVCINAWCYDQAFDEECVRAMVHGYAERRGRVEPAILRRELRRSAWRFAITRITDVYLAGYHRPEKDFQRYLDRLEVWQGPDAEDLLAPG